MKINTAIQDSNTPDMHVSILMATFNGEAHLSRQIDSIQNQSFECWTLWIRDDGSSDGTLSIIEKYSNIDSRIKLIEDECIGGGAAQNFGLLMKYASLKSDADLIAFSDQDDVWLNDKLAIYTDKYAEHITNTSKTVPCLLFSDLAVVNNDLTILDPSFWNMELVDPKVDLTLASVLNRNVMPGCSMMLNRALLNLATPMPDAAVMHDWWILLLAAISGRILVIDKITMYYVQHGGNQLGAKRRTFYISLLKIMTAPFAIISKIKFLHRAILCQSEALLKKDIDAEHKLTVQEFLRVRNGNLITRIINKDVLPSSSFIIKAANILIGT